MYVNLKIAAHVILNMSKDHTPFAGLKTEAAYDAECNFRNKKTCIKTSILL